MWICTKFGFYSIVRKRGTRGHEYHIRGRREEDLFNLQKAADLEDPVFNTPQADYGWRIITGEQEIQKVFIVLGRSIDYPNFKDMISRTEDQRDKLSIYGRIWGLIHSLQPPWSWTL